MSKETWITSFWFPAIALNALPNFASRVRVLGASYRVLQLALVSHKRLRLNVCCIARITKITRPSVECSGEPNSFFNLRHGFRAKLLRKRKKHPRMKLLAKHLDHPKRRPCFRMMQDQAVFENGVQRGTLGNSTQQAVIVFWRNLKHYFHAEKIYFRFTDVKPSRRRTQPFAEPPFN